MYFYVYSFQIHLIVVKRLFLYRLSSFTDALCSCLGLHCIAYATSYSCHASRRLKTIYHELYDSYGKLREATVPIHPCKTASLVPEFAIEDLPLCRIAALMPEFTVKDLPYGQNTLI